MKNVIDFLIHLKVNNDRNWFKENDALYRNAKAEFEAYIDKLIPELKNMDSSIDVESAKSCTFRIFRDVRFSKNKEPYKTNMGGYISKGGRKSVFAGYYVHFEPDASFLGGGIYMPQSPYLKAIRTAIYNDTESFKTIINDPDFKTTFKGIHGEKLKSAPRGFSKDFPDLELIKNKHYAVGKDVSNDFWIKGDPVAKAMKIFQVQYKFNNYLNKIVEKV